MNTVIGQLWVMRSSLEGMQEDGRKGCPTPGHDRVREGWLPWVNGRAVIRKGKKHTIYYISLQLFLLWGRELRHRGGHGREAQFLELGTR